MINHDFANPFEFDHQRNIRARCKLEMVNNSRVSYGMPFKMHKLK